MTAENQSLDARSEALRLKDSGLKVKEITAQLAKSGFKSNRGAPYSVASVAQMLAKKDAVKAPAPKTMAAQTRRVPTSGPTDRIRALHEVLTTKELSSDTKVILALSLIA